MISLNNCSACDQNCIDYCDKNYVASNICDVNAVKDTGFLTPTNIHRNMTPVGHQTDATIQDITNSSVDSNYSTNPPSNEKYLQRKLNRKKRQRNNEMRKAFESLKHRIPNVPRRAKLSKIKILKLTISYIRHLTAMLSDSETGCDTLLVSSFKSNFYHYQVLRIRVGRAERFRLWSGKSKVQISDQANQTKCCHGLPTLRRFFQRSCVVRWGNGEEMSPR